MKRRIATTLVAIAVSIIAGSAARAQTPPVNAWVQWEADGQPHARAIVQDATCPSLTLGGTALPMAERAAPGDGFADRVCDVALPSDYTRGRIGAIELPAIPRAPKRIAMFGDTGCRLKGLEVQACNDAAKWPFPTIVRDIANAHPDLVIHVGDYYYRESACPPFVNCANSPHGDNSDSWRADYFGPMVPLFAAAPLINARGNHEDCKRSARGWIRYLSGITGVDVHPARSAGLHRVRQHADRRCRRRQRDDAIALRSAGLESRSGVGASAFTAGA